MSRFRPATRRQLKLRMAFDGTSGSGKTYTGLRCAFALSPTGRVAVIGTEGSVEDDAAEKYVGEPDPDRAGKTWRFDILHLASFSPSEYTSAIDEAGRLGYEVILVDSLSHAWEGKDGALEMKDRGGKNSFTAWKDITPMHRRMIEAIQSSPAHVICTMRSKTEYVLEKNDQGKEVPRKVGTAPIQRAGMEYEFDIYGSLDYSHILTVTKSRCRSVDGLIVSKPGAGFMAPILEWLETGSQVERAAPAAGITTEQTARIASLLDALGWKMDRIKADLPRKFAVTELHQLTKDQAASLVAWLEGHAKAAAAPKAAPAATNGHATNGHAVPAKPPAPLMHEAATPEQLSELRRLKAELKIGGEEWKALLTPFVVASATALQTVQARKLIEDLAARLAKESATLQESLAAAATAEAAASKGGELPQP